MPTENYYYVSIQTQIKLTDSHAAHGHPKTENFSAFPWPFSNLNSMKFSVCIFDFTKSYTTIIASFWHHLINGWISQAFGSNFRHWSVQDRSRNGWPLILTKLWLLNQFFKTWKQRSQRSVFRTQPLAVSGLGLFWLTTVQNTFRKISNSTLS